jgi:hypothetical protein
MTKAEQAIKEILEDETTFNWTVFIDNATKLAELSIEFKESKAADDPTK